MYSGFFQYIDIARVVCECVYSILNVMGDWSLNEYQTEYISPPGISKKAANLLFWTLQI